MQWANTLFGQGLLDPEIEKRLTAQQKQRMGRGALMDAGLAMLAGSGWQSQPTTLGQGLAQGMQAGRASYAGQAQMMQEQQRQAQERAAAEARARAEAEYMASLPPEMRNMAQVLGVGAFAKSRADQENKLAVEREKAKSKDNRTSLQKEAEAIYPGDRKAQNAWIMQQRAKPTGTTVNINPGSSGELAQRFVTPEQRAQLGQMGIKLPAGVEYVWDKNGRPVALEGTMPNAAQQKADVANKGKSSSVQNAGMLFDQMEQLLDEGVNTGPISGSEVGGIPLGRMADYDRKTMFDAFTKQVSPSLRSVFRIPGEGALSDSEQKQYGLMLPQVTYPEEVNRQLIANLRVMLGNSVPQPDQDDDALINKYLSGN